jgi:hypothetical protein
MSLAQEGPTAVTSLEEHKNAIKFDDPMFSKPMPSAEFIAHLGN